MNSVPVPINAPTAAAAARWRMWLVGGALLIGPFALLLLRLLPSLDLTYQSTHSHFWVVTIAAIMAMAMASLILVAAIVRRDGRSLLIGIAFLALSSLFLVHAISTPGVVFSNTGHATQWSTPLALLFAAIILAISTSRRLAQQPGLINYWQVWLLAGFVLWVGYTLFMLLYVPRNTPTPSMPAQTTLSVPANSYDNANFADSYPAETRPASSIQQKLFALAPRLFPFVTLLNVGLYGFTAFVYGRRWQRTPTAPLAAVAIAAVLLAETAIAAQFGVQWYLSFWLYHVLLLSAVSVVTYGVVRGIERTGSLTSAVEGLLLGATIERQQRAFQDGMGILLQALENGDRAAIPSMRNDLRQRFALAEDQLDLLQHAVAVVAQDREQGRRLQALVDISHTVTLDLAPDELIHTVVATLAKTTHATLAAVGIIEDGLMVVQANHRIECGKPATETLRVPTAALPLQWFLSTDVPYNTPLNDGLAALAVNSGEALLLPLSHHAELIGVLIFQPQQSDECDLRMESVLQAVAAHLATALTNIRLYQVLQHEHAQLHTSEQTREQLNQMIVHDLKNPLTAIVNYLDILKRDAITATQAELLAGARRSSTTMINLVTDLLDSARLQEGRLELRPQVVNLVDILEQCVTDLRAWANQDHKSLNVQAMSRQIMARVDAQLLERVLSNLISNAIKHTPVTTVITVGAAYDQHGLYITVHDNGPGISVGQQATLFERFNATAHSPTQARQRNTGLGLYFCKLAVAAHGGEIRVDSEPPNGTTFIITLPLTVLVAAPQPYVVAA